MSAHIQAVQPVLPTQDVDRAIEYYVGRLGFQLAFQDNPETPGYAGVIRDGVELHLQWHHASEWEAVERPQLRFVVPHVETLFEEYQDKGVFHDNTALRSTDWGTVEFGFFDLDSNALTFYRDKD